MTPPKPPLPTHRNTSTATHNRPHTPRHAPLHLQPLEEPLSPASLGWATGSAPPPGGIQDATLPATSALNSAATGGVLEVGLAEKGEELGAGQLRSPSCRGLLLPPAAGFVTGKQLPMAGSLHTGNLGLRGHGGRVEGISGFQERAPGSAILALPGNGSNRNSASSLPEGAVQLFDRLPERAARLINGGDIDTVAGECWERGPELIMNDGSTVRATFSSPHGLSIFCKVQAVLG